MGVVAGLVQGYRSRALMLVSSPGCQDARGRQRGAGYNGRGRGQLADLQSSVALLVVENTGGGSHPDPGAHAK